jgi:hypothetical protein
VRLLGGLGALMGSAGLLLFLWPGTPSPVIMACLLMLLGVSASGWNGVMVAEIARIVGPARAGAVTGAVLLFGYSGLALAPIGFAAFAASQGTVTAFAGLLMLACLLGSSLAFLPARGPASVKTQTD